MAWGIALDPVTEAQGSPAPPEAPVRKRRPRLAILLLIVNLLILALPVGGLALLRLYETLLLRQTEASLIAQGAFVAEAFRQEVLADLEGARALASYGVEATHHGEEGAPFKPRLDHNRYEPQPPAEDARPAPQAPDLVAQAAGLRLTPILQGAQRVTLAGVRVVDARGVVVATTRTELGLSLAHRGEVSRALTGEATSLIRERHPSGPQPPLESLSRGTRVRVFVALPVVEQGRVLGAVVLSRTPLDTVKGLYGFRAELALGAALLLLTSLLVSALTSRAIVRPVRALMSQARQISQGKLRDPQPLADPGSYEVGELSEAMVHMARSLQERAGYIQTFAANVSHEFKTPLTSIRGTVELLRDHMDEMSPQERDRFLGNLEDASLRLGALVHRLLELARADVVEPGSSQASLEEVLARLVEEHPALSRRIEPEARGAQVQMAPELLSAALGNLVENARRHGGPQAQVEVRARLQGQALVVEVCDDGQGISEANQRRVFERFFTTARSQGGTGLGLPIVKALVERHGGAIWLRSRPGETVVSVKLPLCGA